MGGAYNHFKAFPSHMLGRALKDLDDDVDITVLSACVFIHAQIPVWFEFEYTIPYKLHVNMSKGTDLLCTL